MHNLLFQTLGIPACYTRLKLDNGAQLKEKFLALNLDGANVTVPHKEAAFNACDEHDEFATKLGVVNTIVRRKNSLIGYNTDAPGFVESIKPLSTIHTILILGAGGTTQAIAPALKAAGFCVSIANRSKKRLLPFAPHYQTYTHDTLALDGSFDLIVNATSAGLSDNSLPLQEEKLTPLMRQAKQCIDIIYGKTTPFLMLAQSLHVPTFDGSSMLLYQGALANMHFIPHHTATLQERVRIMQKSFLL